MNVVIATMEHLHQLKNASGLFTHFDIEENGKFLLNAGLVFTAIMDDNPIGCGGVIVKWKGVGELWIAVTDELKKHPYLLLKSTRHMIQMIQEKGNFHRLDLHIVAGDTKLIRWVEALGFRYEGAMVAYGPDKQTHYLYARTYGT